MVVVVTAAVLTVWSQTGSVNNLFKSLFLFSVRNTKFTVTVSLLCDKIKYTHSNASILPKSFAINVDSLY